MSAFTTAVPSALLPHSELPALAANGQQEAEGVVQWFRCILHHFPSVPVAAMSAANEAATYDLLKEIETHTGRAAFSIPNDGVDELEIADVKGFWAAETTVHLDSQHNMRLV